MQIFYALDAFQINLNGIIIIDKNKYFLSKIEPEPEFEPQGMKSIKQNYSIMIKISKKLY